MKKHRTEALIALVMSGLLLMSCASSQNREASDMSEFKKIRPTKTILFVHGMYMTPKVWNEWQTWFQNKGFETLAPAWPHHDVAIVEQNERHPSGELAELTLDDVVAHYRAVIQTLDEPPVVIGHSMGGLVAQKLLQEGITAGAVAVNSAPLKGVLSFKFSFLKANWAHLNLLQSAAKPAKLSFAQFAYAFANDMDESSQQAIYENYMVPESRRVGRGPLGSSGKVDPLIAREPLLLIAGGNDHIIPESLNRSNYREYRHSPSHTDLIAFDERNHLTVIQHGWEDVTTGILARFEKYTEAGKNVSLVQP